MIEYLIGPVVAVAISLQYTKYKTKQCASGRAELLSRIERLERNMAQREQEVLQKVMTTVLPVAKAVNRLNNEVGIK